MSIVNSLTGRISYTDVVFPSVCDNVCDYVAYKFVGERVNAHDARVCALHPTGGSVAN